jgi:ABC-type multidrug transport system ATPase subunit
MSDAIMKALMQLFALISDIHDDTVISVREKEIVRIFLVRNLNNELVSRYMKMYEEYLSIYNSERIIKGSIQDRKRISLNAMRILALCEKINEELQQKQKVYVMVKLADYISSGEEITETELDFLQTVASSFNIPGSEYNDIKSFIMIPGMAGCEGTSILTIDGKNDSGGTGFRHLLNENLKGAVSILRIRSTNTYLMRYNGPDVLYLNGQNIQEGETYVFDSGSSIRGSGIKAVYYSGIVGYFTSITTGDGISLCAENVTYRFRNSGNGVHNLNFTGVSGELAGVIGGSGVGKSTTLSVLSGTLEPVEGHVIINGYNLYDENDRELLKGVIGFVPQDDLLVEELTVYQNLYYNARMCLSNLPGDELEKTIDRILNDLDLGEARDLKVGNPLNKVISGGQRKRINIALELMREPSILFVDEPTSGLSSVDSEMVMNLLKDLTYKGKLVIVNIHQPSSEIYKMFDKIMIIDRGGYQVYCGNPNEAIIYFKAQTNHSNPDEDQCTRCGNIDTEQILRIIEAKVLDEMGKATRVRKISPAEWAKRFKAFSESGSENIIKSKERLPASRFHIPGLLKQSAVFFQRDVLSKLADRQYIIITLLGPPLLAFLLAYFTKTPAKNYHFSDNENIPAYLFMCVITSMFFGLMGSSEEIVKDRKILKRESFLNLSWFSYLNSKVMIMFLVSAIQTLSFVIIGNIVLEIRGMNSAYWLVLFTTSCFANILGLNLSSAFRSVISIYILIPFIIIPQLLFSGVLVKFDKLHTVSRSNEYVPVIGDLMIARWAFEAVATKQFSHNEYEKNFFANELVLTRDENNILIIENLQKDLSFIHRFTDSAQYKPVITGYFAILNKYIRRLLSETGDGNAAGKFMLAPGNFNEASYLETRELLESLKRKFRKKWESGTAVMDSLKKQIGNDRLLEKRLMYENDKLRKLVLGMDIDLKAPLTIETNDKIIIKDKPGLRKSSSANGRAHFYAPFKTIGKMETGTFAFDVTVIWLVTIVLYSLLYFRVFERIISYSENFRIKRPE